MEFVIQLGVGEAKTLALKGNMRGGRHPIKSEESRMGESVVFLLFDERIQCLERFFFVFIFFIKKIITFLYYFFSSTFYSLLFD